MYKRQELLEATDTFRNYTGYTSAKAAIDSFAAKIGGMSTYYNQNGYDYVRGGKEMIFATAKNAKVSSGVYNISIYNTGYDNLVLYGAYVGEPIKDAVWKIKQSGYVYTGLLNGNTYAFRSTDRHKEMCIRDSDYTDSIKDIMASKRYRYFPVLDCRGAYVGMISRRNLLSVKRRQVILVDHNAVSYTHLDVYKRQSLHYVSEWWKQLYGESEGKDQKGIFPASVDLTTDLHSMGQFIQDGSRIMYETVLNVEESQCEIVIGEEPVDLDGLNYLAGKNMDFVNKSAMNGTILAHTDGNVPNLMVQIPRPVSYTHLISADRSVF